jgi:hypothetical protein
MGTLAVIATAAGVLIGYPALVVLGLVWLVAYGSVMSARQTETPRVYRRGSGVENANLYFTFSASCLVAWRGATSGPLGVAVAIVLIGLWFAAIHWARAHRLFGDRL